jgi:hypothetical protein
LDFYAIELSIGHLKLMKIRAADAKEVGVGNPAEETCCYPNAKMLHPGNKLSTAANLAFSSRYLRLYAPVFCPRLAG